MITYHYQTDFKIGEPQKYTDWINNCLRHYNCSAGPIQYVFCSDKDLLEINQKYLNHDFYTDIITFQYAGPPKLSGEIYISVDRVRENADTFGDSFDSELKRVMIHGILHLIGFTDETAEQKADMRRREEELMDMFHVKH